VTVTPSQGLDDLKDVMGAYNALADRLQASQQVLQREVARLNEELAEKNRQLARKNRLEALGEMAAGVAHEIRNPLGGIELYAGLIAREAADNPKVAQWAAKIQAATRNLSQTVGEILDFTRPLKPQMRALALGEIIDSAIELASSAIEGKRIVVVREDKRGATVMADANLLQRGFLNVILNAADAMQDGGTLTVRVAPTTLGGLDAWQVSFADNGKGIDPEDIGRIFDPFFTRKETGTGLGLAMTARIVGAHEGKLSASNAAGGGAVFTFTLAAGQLEGERSKWHG